MSNYHVLTINEKEKRAQVVFHIAIPDEVNGASVNLRTALAQYLTSSMGTITSQVPWNIGTTLASMQAGTIYEHVAEVIFNAGDDANIQKRDIIDAKYNALSVSVVNKTRSILEFWGMDRDVP